MYFTHNDQPEHPMMCEKLPAFYEIVNFNYRLTIMGNAQELSGDLDNALALLKKGDEAAFGLIFDHYAGTLFHFINARIENKESTEEIIEDVFISLWNNREKLPTDSSLETYLLDAAKNKILTYVRSGPVIKKFADDFSTHTPGDAFSDLQTLLF